MSGTWPIVKFGAFLTPNYRPYLLGPDEDANLVGMRLYGGGPFHRELKLGVNISKKSHFRIRAGDVIYNKLFAWKGSFGIVPHELDEMLVSDKFPTYELDRKQVDEQYLKWCFRYPPLWEQARLMSTGSAALSKLTLNPPKFLHLTIPLPSLEEQRKVVAKIEELSGCIDEAHLLRRQSAHATNSLLSSVLLSVLRDIEARGTLGDVLAAPPRNGWSVRCDNVDAGVPVLSLGAVTGFRYRCTEFKRTSEYASPEGHFWLRKGDLLITRSNTPELVGHAAIYDGSPFPCVYPDLMMRLHIETECVDTRFAWYWLQSPTARDYIKRVAKGTSASMKKISQREVMSIPFPRHLPLDVQRERVRELDLLQAQVDLLKARQTETSSELDALLPAILDRAFNGRL